jgi:hypothetical protein
MLESGAYLFPIAHSGNISRGALSRLVDLNVRVRPITDVHQGSAKLAALQFRHASPISVLA